MNGLTERCAGQIAGCLECLDRVVIQGTLPTACYADGMTRFLNARKVRIFDYFDFTKPLKEDIRQNAERIAAEAGIKKIEFIRKLKAFRKEDRIQEILAERGDHPGLVHVFSAMESCSSYQPWHDKDTHRTFLKPDSGKCLHYYFYFIDEELGLCYLRVPTWCPYRLQFYFNGHNWLARQRLSRDRRLGTGPAAGRAIRCAQTASATGPVRGAVLPRQTDVRRAVPLEPDAGRIRHRHRVPHGGRLGY